MTTSSLMRIGAPLALALLLALAGFVTTASASHSWGGYHWGRTANPLALKLGDNVSATWDAHLATASADWSASAVIDTSVVPGSTNPKSCKPTAGRVEVCNSKYGRNGWLGIAQIWVSGLHITQGVVKVNDTYFSTTKYNTPAWRQFVMCQEVGHTFGLDHQDESFTNPNLGTCMDYTNDPSTNQHPNQHDYDMLATMYAHLDSVTTAFNSTPRGGGAITGRPDVPVEDATSDDGPDAWGKEVRKDGRGMSSLYERDLGNGTKVFTFVLHAEP